MPDPIEPTVPGVFDGAPIAHLATVLPDGSPHSTPVHVGTHRDNIVFSIGPGMREARNLRRDPRPAPSVAPAGNPFEPVVVRGRVVDWIDGDAAREIIDRVVAEYADIPYPRAHERVVAIVAVHEQIVGAR